MKEIILICSVVALAALAGSVVNGFNETYRKIHETEQRIERMKLNPSPEYEHYPNPDNANPDFIAY